MQENIFNSFIIFDILYEKVYIKKVLGLFTNRS